MRRHVTAICLSCFVLLFSASIAFASNAMFGEVAAVVLKAELEAGRQVVVYDIRTEGEYLEGHIPGAINVQPQNIRSIDPLSLLAITLEAGATSSMLSLKHLRLTATSLNGARGTRSRFYVVPAVLAEASG